MRYMINRMAAVPLLEVAPGIGDATKITFQAIYKNVLTYLSKIARYCELGFRVVPDFKGKKMTFETYKGIDRTTKQGTKPRVIFSESYNNLIRAIDKINLGFHFGFYVLNHGVFRFVLLPPDA